MKGLSYTEIWISEAQERMVLAVPPEKWAELKALCDREGVEATDLGEFTDTGRLVLRYHGEIVGDLSMDFLHEGRPKVVRKATLHARRPSSPSGSPTRTTTRPTCSRSSACGTSPARSGSSASTTTRSRRGPSVKPLVGEHDDGPGDASVVLPVRGLAPGPGRSRAGSTRAMAGSTPMRWPAASIDEAIRNCVAVGADPDRIALLDNFCWGNTERPETLGALVLAAQGCHDLALAYGTPFISGKDSLYNEYTHEGRSLAIPPTLLISAIGQVPDVRKCVTMDLKEPGNVVLLAGHDPARTGRVALDGQPGPRRGACPPGRPRAWPRPVPRRPRGDQPRPDPRLPRPERGRPGRRPGRDGDRRRPRPRCLAPRRALRRRVGPRRRPALLRVAVAIRPRSEARARSATLFDLFGTLPLGRLGEVTGADDVVVRGLGGHRRPRSLGAAGRIR